MLFKFKGKIKMEAFSEPKDEYDIRAGEHYKVRSYKFLDTCLGIMNQSVMWDKEVYEVERLVRDCPVRDYLDNLNLEDFKSIEITLL